MAIGKSANFISHRLSSLFSPTCKNMQKWSFIGWNEFCRRIFIFMHLHFHMIPNRLWNYGVTNSYKSLLKMQMWKDWYFVSKIVLTYVEKKCSSNWEKLLKFKVEGQELAKFLRLEQFIRTVKGQYIFLNIMLFKIVPRSFSDLIQIGKKSIRI